MLQYTFLCVILFMGQHYAVVYLGHNYEYVPEADTWLRLHMWADYWPEARQLCQLEGGLLASPSTTALAQAMLRIMSSHNVHAVFTGIHALITERDYESLDGVPLSEIPLNWDWDKIDYRNRLHNCVLLNTTGKVNDVSCTSPYRYFCRKETAVMNTTHECRTTVSGQHYAVGYLGHDYEYVPEADTWLRLHRLGDYWTKARHLCQLEGGLLASPSTTALAQAMLRIMSSHEVRVVFTGMNALITEGEYEFLDGVPLSVISLDWDKPNVYNYRRDACVALNTTGKVNNVGCLSIYPYFCRKETAVMNATHECQTSASGYELEPRTGSCYKFHQAIQTWECRAEGGNLAIIKSDLESQVLQDILRKYPKDTVVRAENSDGALIGVWKWDDFNGEWQTNTTETDGYELEPRTGSCYKFHQDIQTWECRAEGGNLAIIKSDLESQVLQDILRKYPKDTVVRAENSDGALIGVWKWDDFNGEWQTNTTETDGQHYAVGYLGHDYEYVPEADTWLRLHMLPDYWPEARRVCQLEGGLLASPSTTALAQAMLRIMSSHDVHAVFTGIHALITERDYESLDGVPLSEIPLNWDWDKIDHKNRLHNCVLLNTTGKVNDVSCTSPYPYFCRKETAVMNTTHDCQTTVSGYELEPRTGSCYKFHPLATMWHRAASECRTEGGNLAIINSDLESQVLQDIFKKYPKDTIVGADNFDAALIGVWKWGIFFKGEWQTIEGQTLEKAGFAQWSDELDENGYAAAVKRSGLLFPVRRYDKYPFICEITP